ncbi:1-deoxy-D-xylulose-5-phosphate synthase [Bacteroidales bacterium Barb6XT]|nr:1-deoxy-D-xylulose-5-phosphate synthase [Bacteroidales bacterium Barb6XT]
MSQMEMRAVYAQTLIELAEKDERFVLLEADLMKASGTAVFKDKFPERVFNTGVAEANMVGIAAGLSAGGKIPFADTFACFASRRTYDQFFVSANYAHLNVKLVGTDPGIAAAYNGGTHMTFEDIGIMRNIPRLVVFEPSDPVSLRKLVQKSAYHKGCTYMRLHRQPVTVIYPEDEEFELGKGKVLRDGTDITVLASGAIMVAEALKAWDVLNKDGISAAVIDIHTIKPIDAELVLQYAKKTGAIITCENHQVINGLGSAVAEVLSENYPCRLKRIGINDEFGEVGTQNYLQKHFGLTADNIVAHAKELLGKKKQK